MCLEHLEYTVQILSERWGPIALCLWFGENFPFLLFPEATKPLPPSFWTFLQILIAQRKDRDQSNISTNKSFAPLFNKCKGIDRCGLGFSQPSCLESAYASSLIMHLKSFSWAEQIFTAYFAENGFAWRKVLPLGWQVWCANIYTFTYLVTRGPHGAEQVADKQVPKNKYVSERCGRCQPGLCVLGPTVVSLWASAVPPWQP